jgi:hypothetical protein
MDGELIHDDAVEGLIALSESAPKQSFKIDEVKLKELAIFMYGKPKVDEWTKAGKNVRKIFELSRPTTQCNNTIGPSTGKTCWLCGLGFDKRQAFTPQCEHVLPIAQAVYYLELYSSDNSKPADIDFLKLEYEWAHPYCNYRKTDSIFIKESTEKVNGYPLCEIDLSGIQNFILKLKTGNSTLRGFQAIQNYVVANDPTARIIERLGKILERINEKIKKGEGGLSMLSYVSDFFNNKVVNPGFLDKENAERPSAKRLRVGGKSRGRKRTHRHRRTRRNKHK